MNPHIKLWLAGDSIMVEYPDGQQIPVPAIEPGRILTILRSLKVAGKEDPWLAQRKFVAAFSDDDVKKRGAEIRAKEAKRVEEKLAQERRARERRMEKRDKLKQANELLAIVGL